MNKAMRKDERTLRRYLAGLEEAAFDVRLSRSWYELLTSLVRLPLRDHEALDLPPWDLQRRSQHGLGLPIPDHYCRRDSGQSTLEDAGGGSSRV